MGLFWNRKKDTAAPQTSEVSVPKPQEKPAQPVAVPSPEDKPPPPKPQPQQKQEPIAPAAPQPKPVSEIEMRKVIFRLSSQDPEKCTTFVKEVIRRVNRHDWHTLSGRIGKHIDGGKMRMDIKGKPEDINAFIQWCKTDHVGVHINQVVESKVYRMPYSGTPLFQELKGSWPSS
jgi:hypothetical protein